MKEEENIEPTLLFSVLCDDVRREDNGKFMLMGLFETISATDFPVRHPSLYVMNCWCSGMGEFRQQTRLVEPDGAILVEDKETAFSLQELRAKHRVVAKFNNILFKEPGEYSIEVLLNSELKVRYPLIVEKAGIKRNAEADF